MGSGIGMATGAITSGAIDRAIDRHKADKALKDAESEHEDNTDVDEKKAENSDEEEKETQDAEKDDKKATKDNNEPKDSEKGDKGNTKDNDEQQKWTKRCTNDGNYWMNNTCICKNGGKWNTKNGICGASPFGNDAKLATGTQFNLGSLNPVKR